jgi:hypothetical protein
VGVLRFDFGTDHPAFRLPPAFSPLVQRWTRSILSGLTVAACGIGLRRHAARTSVSHMAVQLSRFAFGKNGPHQRKAGGTLFGMSPNKEPFNAVEGSILSPDRHQPLPIHRAQEVRVQIKLRRYLYACAVAVGDSTACTPDPDMLFISKEPRALAEIAARFPEPDYRTKPQVVLPKTDADLVVYERATGCAIVLQHKWLIAPDTLNESASNDEELNSGARRRRWSGVAIIARLV